MNRRFLAFLTVVLIVFTLIAGGRIAGAHASPLPPRVLTGQTPQAVEQGTATYRGHHKSADVLTLHIGLGVHNTDRLNALIAAVGNPAGPLYGHYLTRAQYMADYAPTDAEVQAVRAWATAAGFTVRAISPDHLYVTVRATTLTIERALGVTINDYSLPDRSFRSNDRDPSVPSGLDIRAISGLTTILRLQIMLSRPHDLRDCGVGVGFCYIPADFRSAYNATSIADATGQTIGLTLWGPNVPDSDFQAFTSYINGAGDTTPGLSAGSSGPDTIEWIGVNGDDPAATVMTGTANIQNAQGEVALDAEYAHSMAPHSHLRYWLGNMLYDPQSNDYYPDNLGLEDALSAAANDPSLSAVSNSWGGPDATLQDPPFVSNADATLQHAASVGLTFYFSSGDQGYLSGSGSACQQQTNPPCTTALPSFPAEDPNVVAVGGTSLNTDSNQNYSSESGWSGSGGGCTTVFARPAWQTGTGTAPCTATAGGPGRTVPDVAADADPNTGAYVYVGGQAQVIGGTSLAAPLWAGFAADINRYLSANGKPAMGFAAPEIYALTNNATTYARDFYDVQTGNNDPNGLGNGYNAGAGYDLVTGWGSPNIANLAADWTTISLPTPTAVPTNTSTPTATNTPIPTSTAVVAIASPTGVSTLLQRVPTATVGPSSQPTGRSPGTHATALALTVTVSGRSVRGGGVLAFHVRTVPHAQVSVTLEVAKVRVVITRKGHHVRRTVHTVVLYRVAGHGTAGSHGLFNGRLRVRYKPVRAVQALLIVKVHRGRVTTTHTIHITIRRAPAARHRHSSL